MSSFASTQLRRARHVFTHFPQLRTLAGPNPTHRIQHRQHASQAAKFEMPESASDSNYEHMMLLRSVSANNPMSKYDSNLKPLFRAAKDGMDDIFRLILEIVHPRKGLAEYNPQIAAKLQDWSISAKIRQRDMNKCSTQLFQCLDRHITVEGELRHRVGSRFRDLQHYAKIPFSDVKRGGSAIIDILESHRRHYPASLITQAARKAYPVNVDPKRGTHSSRKALRKAVFAISLLKRSDAQISLDGYNVANIYTRLKGDMFVRELQSLMLPFYFKGYLSSVVLRKFDQQLMFSVPLKGWRIDKSLLMKAKQSRALLDEARTKVDTCFMELERILDERLSLWQDTWETHAADPNYPKPPLLFLPAPSTAENLRKLDLTIEHIDERADILQRLKYQVLTAIEDLDNGAPLIEPTLRPSNKRNPLRWNRLPKKNVHPTPSLVSRKANRSTPVPVIKTQNSTRQIDSART